MFTSVSIANYRGLKSLKLDPLGRINLIAGANNSGKTSLLEAVFLLAHGGNAGPAINSHVVRGGIGGGVSPDANARALWNPLFADLDVSREIEISGQHSSYGALILKIEHRYSKTVQTALANRDSRRGMAGTPELRFSLTRRLRKRRPLPRVHSQIHFGANGPEVKTSGDPIVVPCAILSSCADQQEEDAKRLGALRVRKQADVVVDALRVIEPRLRAIDVIPGPGGHTLWGDVGLSEQLPLATLGDGLNRLARLVLAMGQARHFVVLVDEIENGYHHSVLERVWEVVFATAERFDTQVIATTHSYESIKAAHRASDGLDFRLHRLESDDDGIRCVSYDPESLDGAFGHHLEVR